MMKKLLLLLSFAGAQSLSAQDIPPIKGDQITRWMAANNDTVYVVNFWATWCKPCVEELPIFERINAEYAGRPVRVILVNTNFKRDLDTQVKPFIKRKKLRSQVVFMDESNPNTWINLVNPDWSGAIPATTLRTEWITSGDLKKAWFFEGQITYEMLREQIDKALQAKP